LRRWRASAAVCVVVGGYLNSNTYTQASARSCRRVGGRCCGALRTTAREEGHDAEGSAGRTWLVMANNCRGNAQRLREGALTLLRLRLEGTVGKPTAFVRARKLNGTKCLSCPPLLFARVVDQDLSSSPPIRGRSPLDCSCARASSFHVCGLHAWGGMCRQECRIFLRRMQERLWLSCRSTNCSTR